MVCLRLGSDLDHTIASSYNILESVKCDLPAIDCPDVDFPALYSCDLDDILDDSHVVPDHSLVDAVVSCSASDLCLDPAVLDSGCSVTSYYSGKDLYPLILNLFLIVQSRMMIV